MNLQSRRFLKDLIMVQSPDQMKVSLVEAHVPGLDEVRVEAVETVPVANFK